MRPELATHNRYARLGLSAFIGMASYEDANYEEVDAEVAYEWEHEAGECDW